MQTPQTTPELLAPAGSFEAACAAFQYGADAVYTGLPKFSARADAKNLDTDRLEVLLAYAHGLSPRRKVYVAMNTLVQNNEIEAAIETLGFLNDLGVDALIVQDIGLARLARQFFPKLILHASTQMAVHNLDGVNMLAELGFKRVILARELTVKEITAIVQNGNLEVETFIHGALCHSYSGLCLYSSMIHGRSGNRGRCAYCCREPFMFTGHPDAKWSHPYSMRDLSLAHIIPEWLQTGITSVKIEGRMKSPLYVAAVVDFYRRIIDKSMDAHSLSEYTQDLQTIFSRPWTELYALDATATPETIIDSAAIGHRGAPIGVVKNVKWDQRKQPWLCFMSSRALEKHDGLQIEPPGGGEPVGFGITALRHSGSTSLEVALPGNIEVEVLLPKELVSQIRTGMLIHCSASQAVRRHYPVKLPQESGLKISHPAIVHLSLEPTEIQITANSLPIDETTTSVKATLTKKVALDVARNPEGAMPAIQKAFGRTGDTRWQINNITLSNPKKLFISPTLLNTLRREVLDALTAAFNKNQAVRQANILATINENEIDGRLTETVTSIKKPCWNVKLRLDQQPFEGLENAAEIIVRISHVANRQYEQQWLTWHARNPQVKLRLALPLITREIDNPALEATAAKWIQNGYASWECADLAGVIMVGRLSKKYGCLDLTSDWSLYAINKPAQTQLAEFGIKRYVVSPEENLHNLQQMISGPPSPEIIMFQHTPLFISATAPLSPLEFQYNEHIIGISDRRGRQFKTIKIDHEYITIQESQYCLSDYFRKLVASGIFWYRADFSFSVEPPETLLTWWSDICSGKTVTNSHTGNFLRGFL